jgi:hypothetical protein
MTEPTVQRGTLWFWLIISIDAALALAGLGLGSSMMTRYDLPTSSASWTRWYSRSSRYFRNSIHDVCSV